jgi:threonine/homoserine/homoserine lactone efflux protein
VIWLLDDFMPAALLGFLIAIPFGPVCLICVQRTLALGIWFGIASGMGAAVAHGLFGLLAVASTATLAQLAPTVEMPLRVAGGFALIFVGLRSCLVRTARPALEARCGDLCSAFVSTLLIAASNPMTMLPYLAIAGEPQAASPLIIGRGFAAPIGVMLGSACWYLIVALSTNAVFHNRQKARVEHITRLAGIFLIGLGAAICAQVI